MNGIRKRRGRGIDPFNLHIKVILSYKKTPSMIITPIDEKKNRTIYFVNII
jgi:hypothetical protein